MAHYSFAAASWTSASKGCYVETRAHLRLQAGTPVEMAFSVNGVRFRIAATSRIVRPGAGAGFCFQDLNPRMQTELDALIKAASESSPVQ
jgi:hypothetical protein